MSRLLIIIPDALSEIVSKGEFASRYYNPAELFDEVHVLSLTDDRVDPAAVQETVGRAALHLHNLPVERYLGVRSFGWRPSLLRHWAQPALELAARVRPDLIRCYAAGLNSFIAERVKAAMGIPYIVSVHTVPDESDKVSRVSLKRRFSIAAMRPLVARSLHSADKVIAVYAAIIPYLEDLGVRDAEVAYNVLNPAHLRVKEDYSLGDPVRILSVGRQIDGKSPDNLIRAMTELPRSHLTLVGDGPIHESLEAVARESGVAGRVRFERSVPNDELCDRLPNYDIFASHSDYLELPKAVIEPLLCGLPVIVNRRAGRQVPEFEGADFLMLVENTPRAYASAIRKLIEDDVAREGVGRRAATRAAKHWSPIKTEQRLADIYRSVLGSYASAGVYDGSTGRAAQ